MGRNIKNPKTHKVGAISVGVPTGSTADRMPDTIAGSLRFNSDTSKLEIYNGTAYNTVAQESITFIVQDNFTGDGATTAFTLSKSVYNNETQRIMVCVGNVFQNPASAYTLNGTTITFTSPPGSAETITVIHGFDSTST